MLHTYVYLLIAWWLPGFSMANCHNQMVQSPARSFFLSRFNETCAKCLSTPRAASRHIETQRLYQGFYQRFYRFTYAVSRPFCISLLVVPTAYRFYPILVDLHTPWVFDAVDERTCLIMFDCLTFKIQYCQGCEADLLFCFTLIHICMCTDTLYISLSSSWPREQVRWPVRKC